nr:cation:dicarboxylase symporter family transporter [Brachyspira hyodysenteriae]
MCSLLSCCILIFLYFLPYIRLYCCRKIWCKIYEVFNNPMITSLSTQSSIATLPINLEASEKIGVSEDVRNIVLPIGATAHMDGTCLSGILKIAFLYGVFGMNFTGIDVWIGSIIFVTLAGMANGAIPGGGLISEMLIVSIYGFPPEAFPLIATIGILVDPPATMVNSVGDNVAGMLVSRIVEGKDWFKNRIVSNN